MIRAVQVILDKEIKTHARTDAQTHALSHRQPRRPRRSPGAARRAAALAGNAAEWSPDGDSVPVKTT